MKAKIGFTANTSCHEAPIVDICIDDRVLKRVLLNRCGRSDDPAAKIQYVNIDLNLNDQTCSTHILSIRAVNISNDVKLNGDFGFQVRYVEINQVIIDWFSKSTTTYNPVTDEYVRSYIEPNNKTSEIQVLNNQPIHVLHGQYANYVNMPNGWFELVFDTPLYNWVLGNFFGNLSRILVKV